MNLPDIKFIKQLHFHFLTEKLTEIFTISVMGLFSSKKFLEIFLNAQKNSRELERNCVKSFKSKKYNLTFEKFQQLKFLYVCSIPHENRLVELGRSFSNITFRLSMNFIPDYCSIYIGNAGTAQYLLVG